MKRLTIDVSAQMGDEASDAALLPHFQALKRAFSASGTPLPCKQVERMAYVLRVSGSITNFNFEGCEAIDLNRGKKYISIDVGVPIARWKDQSDAEISQYLASVLPDGLDQMLARLRAEKIVCDDTAVRVLFEQGLARYVSAWRNNSTATG